MFRRRDEEENAIDAANANPNTAGDKSEATNKTSFGSYSGKDSTSAKKDSETSSRSLFGVNSARKEAAEAAEAAKTGKLEANKEEAPAKPVFTKPASENNKPAATYKLTAGGAVKAVEDSEPASSASAAPSMRSLSGSPSANLSAQNSSASITASSSTNSISNIGSTSKGTNMDNIETEKRLTVGYGIELEGKISNCDKLIVYGHVQADLTDVKTLHISESGKFSGFAAIDNAEISGAFEGDLIVKDSITINSTGKMNGKVTYGSIEIKPGGKFTGQIVDASDASSFGAKADSKKSSSKAAAEAKKNQEEFTLSPEPVAEKEEVA